MTTVIRGTDNSVSAPAITGTDSDTGVYFPAANQMALATNGTQAVFIDSSQNVGIGTSSPAAKLNLVAGDSATATNQVNISGGRSLGGGVYGSAGSILFTNGYWSAGYGAASISGMDSGGSGGFLGFATTTNGGGTTGTPTERMRIDSSGNLLVNTTTSNSNTFKFKVQAATDVCVGVASATTVAGALTLNAINDANSVNVPLDFRASSIHASNGIATTANAANANFSAGENNKFYRSTSALKYKQDIRDIELIDINRFRPVRYKSKCEDDDQTKDHFGIIADEVHAAGLTELVTYGAEQEVEGFQYERLTVVLLKHCQEQQAIIQSLTDRIAALEAKG